MNSILRQLLAASPFQPFLIRMVGDEYGVEITAEDKVTFIDSETFRVEFAPIAIRDRETFRVEWQARGWSVFDLRHLVEIKMSL